MQVKKSNKQKAIIGLSVLAALALPISIGAGVGASLANNNTQVNTNTHEMSNVRTQANWIQADPLANAYNMYSFNSGVFGPNWSPFGNNNPFNTTNPNSPFSPNWNPFGNNNPFNTTNPNSPFSPNWDPFGNNNPFNTNNPNSPFSPNWNPFHNSHHNPNKPHHPQTKPEHNQPEHKPNHPATKPEHNKPESKPEHNQPESKPNHPTARPEHNKPEAKPEHNKPQQPQSSSPNINVSFMNAVAHLLNSKPGQLNISTDPHLLTGGIANLPITVNQALTAQYKPYINQFVMNVLKNNIKAIDVLLNNASVNVNNFAIYSASINQAHSTHLALFLAYKNGSELVVSAKPIILNGFMPSDIHQPQHNSSSRAARIAQQISQIINEYNPRGLSIKETNLKDITPLQAQQPQYTAQLTQFVRNYIKTHANLFSSVRGLDVNRIVVSDSNAQNEFDGQLKVYLGYLAPNNQVGTSNVSISLTGFKHVSDNTSSNNVATKIADAINNLSASNLNVSRDPNLNYLTASQAANNSLGAVLSFIQQVIKNNPSVFNHLKINDNKTIQVNPANISIGGYVTPNGSIVIGGVSNSGVSHNQSASFITINSLPKQGSLQIMINYQLNGNTTSADTLITLTGFQK